MVALKSSVALVAVTTIAWRLLGKCRMAATSPLPTVRTCVADVVPEDDRNRMPGCGACAGIYVGGGQL